MGYLRKRTEGPARELTDNKPRRVQLYRHLGMANNSLQKTLLHFTEDDYRQILYINGAKMLDGKFSAKTMTIREMEQALSHCKGLGFKLSARHRQNFSNSNKQENWKKPRVAKLNAMWIALFEADIVQNGSEAAMKTFVENRIKGLERFEWISSEQLNKAVEIMKKMMRQHDLNPNKF